MPERAVVLAAGLGTRLRPVSGDVPKPMMPLWDRPLVARVLDALHTWGVRHVLINLHHGAAQVMQGAMAYAPFGLQLDFSFEPEILGTGGVLRRAAWFLDDQPFWMVNADLAMRLDPHPLVQRFRPPRTIAVLWMHGTRGPRTVKMGRHGWIQDFAVKHPGAPGTTTFCGLQLLSPRIIKFIPESGYSTIVDAYRAAQAAGWRVAGLELPDAYWADVGTPERYLEAHQETAAWWGEGETSLPATRVLFPLERDALSKRGWSVNQTEVTPFPARGSARSFARVSEGKRRAILMRYDPVRVENTMYTAQARFLARVGVRVPAVLWDSPSTHRALLEDLGGEDLVGWLNQRPEQRRTVYRRVLDAVLDWHKKATPALRRARVPLMPPFARDLYQWEHDLFYTHYLKTAAGWTPNEKRTLRSVLTQVARHLETVRPVLVHRDLQSSNILWVHRKPAFIDFQGMRLGPAAYDLASLLCDPYMELPEEERDELLTRYEARMDPSRFRRVDYHAAVIQRLAQALGAYGRLSVLPGCERFRAYIPPAERMLRAGVTLWRAL